MAGKNEAKIRFAAETEEFTSAIRDANSEMATLRAEMKLNEAQFQNTGDQTEYLQQKAELLESQLQANAEKQEALTQKLEAAKSIYGEDSEEVARLERQLIYTQVQEEKLKSQLDDTNQSLNGQSQAAEEAGSSKAVNIVLLGRLSHYFDLPEDAWMASLEANVPPKFLAMNKKAFALGRDY